MSCLLFLWWQTEGRRREDSRFSKKEWEREKENGTIHPLSPTQKKKKKARKKLRSFYCEKHKQRGRPRLNEKLNPKVGSLSSFHVLCSYFSQSQPSSTTVRTKSQRPPSPGTIRLGAKLVSGKGTFPKQPSWLASEWASERTRTLSHTRIDFFSLFGLPFMPGANSCLTALPPPPPSCQYLSLPPLSPAPGV